jgi:DNA primase
MRGGVYTNRIVGGRVRPPPNEQEAYMDRLSQETNEDMERIRAEQERRRAQEQRDNDELVRAMERQNTINRENAINQLRREVPEIIRKTTNLTNQYIQYMEREGTSLEDYNAFNEQDQINFLVSLENKYSVLRVIADELLRIDIEFSNRARALRLTYPEVIDKDIAFFGEVKRRRQSVSGRGIKGGAITDLPDDSLYEIAYSLSNRDRQSFIQSLPQERRAYILQMLNSVETQRRVLADTQRAWLASAGNPQRRERLMDAIRNLRRLLNLGIWEQDYKPANLAMDFDAEED